MIPVETVVWRERRLVILDQTRLPGEIRHITLTTAEEVWEAINVLRVRGAPAIGVCAAYGVLAALLHANPDNTIHAKAEQKRICEYLAGSRPTAVNLFYALDRMKGCADTVPDTAPATRFLETLESEANAIYAEDMAMCKAIGVHGAPLITEGCGVLTHCNAGGLATSGYGTALAPMYVAKEQGRAFSVYADETRPLMQGARLTAWELYQAGIDVTLICDSMAAVVMRQGRINLVIVGADRIAANGDTANKIGTFAVAALARLHQIPFYVAAPASTFDPNTADGGRIQIELRDPSEITYFMRQTVAPEGVNVYNPAFDITPADLISGFITDQGLLSPPYAQNFAAAFGWK